MNERHSTGKSGPSQLVPWVLSALTGRRRVRSRCGHNCGTGRSAADAQCVASTVDDDRHRERTERGAVRVHALGLIRVTDRRTLAQVKTVLRVDTACILRWPRWLGSARDATGRQREAEQRRCGATEPNSATRVGSVGDTGRSARAMQYVHRLLLASARQREHLLPTGRAVEIPVVASADGAGTGQRQNRKLHVATIGRNAPCLQALGRTGVVDDTSG